MKDTKLLFLEGLPGSGKSTTASWLASRLQSDNLTVRLYLEHQPEHPLNVGGDSHPAGDVSGEVFFQQYTPESFVDESLRKWEMYVREASQSEVIGIFDSYPFQNTVRVLMQLDASIEYIREYASQVERLTRSLKPVLIYMNFSNTAQAIQNMNDISEQRGKLWAEYVEGLITNCPYSLARNLKGQSGVEAFIIAYKQLTDELLRQSHLPRFILEQCSASWDDCYQQIEAFLELSWQG